MNFLARLVNAYRAPQQADPPPPVEPTAPSQSLAVRLPAPTPPHPTAARGEPGTEGDIDPATLAA